MPDRILEPSKWFLSFLYWLAAILIPTYEIMGAVVFLISVDFITGIAAAYKRGEPVRASKMVNTVGKFFFYSLVILCGFAVERFIVQEIPLNKIVSGFIALTELKSIFENFNKIYGIDLMNQLREWFKTNSLSTIFKIKDDANK